MAKISDLTILDYALITTINLVILKLAGIQISWIAAFSPLWVFAAVLALLIGIAAVGIGIAYIVVLIKRSKNKNRTEEDTDELI